MHRDIFVSYAHVDNDPMPGVERGWVTLFVEGLKKSLAREIGRRDGFDLWMDYELRGNARVTSEIAQIVGGARTLLLFLSKGYLESQWCARELEVFLSRAEAIEGRIFVVSLSPTDDVPAALADLKKYVLWEADEAGQVRTLGDPQPDPMERAYYDRLRELGRDLAAMLGNAKRVALPAVDDKLIFVSGGLEDIGLLRSTAEQLARRGMSYSLPIAATEGMEPATIDPSFLERDLEENLALCDAVLLVHDHAPAIQINQFIKQYLKAKARRPERPPKAIAVCKKNGAVGGYGLNLPDLKILSVGEPCPQNCVDCFAEVLRR